MDVKDNQWLGVSLDTFQDTAGQGTVAVCIDKLIDRLIDSEID